MLFHAGHMVGSGDPLKGLCRMYKSPFLLCLLDLFLICSHHISCLQAGQMNILRAQALRGTRAVKGNISAAQDDDMFADACLFSQAGFS